MTPTIRWTIRADYQEILEFEKVLSGRKFSFADLVNFHKQRHGIGMVAEVGGLIVGYMMYELHKNHLRLVRLVVDPAARRRGVGRSMIERLESKLNSHRRYRIVAVCLDTRTDVHLFLQAQGFLATGVERQKEGPDLYTFKYEMERTEQDDQSLPHEPISRLRRYMQTQDGRGL